MKSILSTKKLKPNQRDLLLGQGFSLVDYNAIEIEFVDFTMPEKIENAIFTSQNGVQSILNSDPDNFRDRIQNCFCVGQKTKALLGKNGFKVIETANYGAELAQIIIKNYKDATFYQFCAEERRDEIPDALKTAGIKHIEINTYRTTLKPRKFEQKWDGILFFSPSGVESFTLGQQDPVGLSAKAICIGETTADAAKKYFKNVIIANTTTIESVIAKAVKILKV